MAEQTITNNGDEKKELMSGKPRKNAFIIILAILIVVAGVFNYFNNKSISQDETVKQEGLNEKKIKDSAQKSISIEEMTKAVERSEPTSSASNEEIDKLKKDLDKEKSRNKSIESLNNPPVNNSHNGDGYASVNGTNPNSPEELKRRNEEMIAGSQIYYSSTNKKGLLGLDQGGDEIQNLYKEQNNLLRDTLNQGSNVPDEKESSDILGKHPILKQDQDANWLKEQSQSQNSRQLEAVRVTKAINPNKTIYEGTVLPVAVTQVTSSDFPGKFAVKTTRPVYSRNGQVLLDRGATILGVANTNVRPGQERVQAAFYRIITNKGDSIYLSGMQGVDEEGVIGLNGDINNHYFKMFAASFGVALLQNIIQKNDNGITVNNPSGDVSISTGAVETLGDIAKTQLERNKTLPPTIKLIAGKEFNITVVKDIIVDVD